MFNISQLSLYILYTWAPFNMFVMNYAYCTVFIFWPKWAGLTVTLRWCERTRGDRRQFVVRCHAKVARVSPSTTCDLFSLAANSCYQTRSPKLYNIDPAWGAGSLHSHKDVVISSSCSLCSVRIWQRCVLEELIAVSQTKKVKRLLNGLKIKPNYMFCVINTKFVNLVK